MDGHVSPLGVCKVIYSNIDICANISSFDPEAGLHANVHEHKVRLHM
jgi:hypothetical protein